MNAAPQPQNAGLAQSPVSGLLQPALAKVHETLSAVRTDKWKKGSVRDEATNNIDSIQNDLRANVPSLLEGADAAPGSVSNLLSVSRHIGALYDVLLRVVEASRVAAPDDQVEQLQKALLGLSNARLAFEDRVRGSADVLEKQVSDLRATLQQQEAQRAATPVPVALPCVPPPARRTTTRARKPAAKPSAAKTPSSTATQPSAQPATH